MADTLTLTVASDPVSVPDPDSGHPDTQVWYTAEWEPHAWFYPVGPDYWVRLLGIGAFRVSPGGDVLAVPDEEAPFSLVLDAYRRTVLPQARKFERHGITGIEAPELTPVERQTRALVSPELAGDEPAVLEALHGDAHAA